MFGSDPPTTEVSGWRVRGERERERESDGTEFYLKNPTPPGAAQ